MAKIKHHNFLNTVHEVFSDAKREGVLHLYAEGESFSGRKIQVENRELFHFGTTGYLGLEQDSRLKNAAIEAVENYGTQFPLSKSYISNPLYRELEARIREMFQAPIIITKNSTLGHLGVIPSAVGDNDAIILDHQVHWSVQNAAKMLKTRSVPIDMVRHNHLGMLEDKLRKYIHSKRHVWYMADGIYSMYGDYAPVDDLMELASQYPQLRLYFDDVHGMSWVGKNGTGYVLSRLGELPHNVLLFGTLSKTFGASGAVLVCSDKQLYNRIKTFGGPLTFSAQLEPASVAAAIASAKIHLTDEIYALQSELRERIDYFNSLIQATDLPLIDKNESPVFYIGTGMPKTGYNLVNRLMKEGFFVNLGIFPAVPVKNTGMRITISRHNRLPEIKALVEAIEHHYPKALEDCQTTREKVYRAFKLNTADNGKVVIPKGMQMVIEDSITKVNKPFWNSCMGGKGVYDWDGLRFLETVFSGHSKKEHNWRFRYIIILDDSNNPVLVTFCTCSLWKDDMLAKESVSRIIEMERENAPYHLTSMVLSLGSLFTEGDHMFWNEDHPKAMDAVQAMMSILEELVRKFDSRMLVLRDFDKESSWHRELQGLGFIRIQMPDSCEVAIRGVEDMETHIANLSARNRRHFRKDIQPFLERARTRISKKCPAVKLEKLSELFNQVHARNLGLNTFRFPKKLFEAMNNHPAWEFIMLSPVQNPNKIIGVMFCYTNSDEVYVPAFVGMDYGTISTFGTYRQLLYHTIERAIKLNLSRIDLGMTASFEKRKLGAEVREKYAYIQSPDNYTLELLGMMERE